MTCPHLIHSLHVQRYDPAACNIITQSSPVDIGAPHKPALILLAPYQNLVQTIHDDHHHHHLHLEFPACPRNMHSSFTSTAKPLAHALSTNLTLSTILALPPTPPPPSPAHTLRVPLVFLKLTLHLAVLENLQHALNPIYAFEIVARLRASPWVEAPMMNPSTRMASLPSSPRIELP
jgi:hypothetical protein